MFQFQLWQKSEEMIGRNLIRYISVLSTLYFLKIKISFSSDNRARRWLAGTQSDLLTSTLFGPEAVFQVQRSMNVRQSYKVTVLHSVIHSVTQWSVTVTQCQTVLHSECIKTENIQVEEKVVQVASLASGATYRFNIFSPISNLSTKKAYWSEMRD